MDHSKRLIVFFIPPEKLVNGGILSIFSICKVSREFKEIHNAEVVISTIPGTKSYRKNDLFENDETVYTFDEVVAWGPLDFLMLHVPEQGSYNSYVGLKKYEQFLKTIPDLRINMLTQNILLLQPPLDVANWFRLTSKVTQTTAHDKYTTQELADTYNLPTKHLSTFVDMSQYVYTPYEKKENIIAFSPDEVEDRAKIENHLKESLPDYKLVTIKNLSYEEYKKFISKAKFVVTFGEGFDGYYVESFFSGGIAFAVYNEEFFPDTSFAQLENTFSDYGAMLAGITNAVKKLDDKMSYQSIVKKNLDRINALYSYTKYVRNIKDFYLGNYTYRPSPGSSERLIGLAMDELDKTITEMTEMVREKDKTIAGLGDAVGQRDTVITGMVNSISWKLTKPLRSASAAIKKKP